MFPRRHSCVGSAGIEISRNVACFLLRNPGDRHRRSWIEGAWVSYPCDQILWRVAKHAANIEALAHLFQRRTCKAVGAWSSGNDVATGATVADHMGAGSRR